jgi:hypothetical protein
MISIITTVFHIVSLGKYVEDCLYVKADIRRRISGFCLGLNWRHQHIDMFRYTLYIKENRKFQFTTVKYIIILIQISQIIPAQKFQYQSRDKIIIPKYIQTILFFFISHKELIRIIHDSLN